MNNVVSFFECRAFVAEIRCYPMNVIDFHTHLFPDKIAKQAMDAPGRGLRQVPPLHRRDA